MTLSFLFRLDMLVLDTFFQPLAERVERATGMNCFRVAAHLIMCGIGLFAARAFYSIILWRTGEFSASFMFATALCTPFLMYFWKQVYDAADRAARRIEEGSVGSKPMFSTFLPWRVFCLLFLPVDALMFHIETWFLLGVVQDAVLTAGLYFMSCVPKPPRRAYTTRLMPA